MKNLLNKWQEAVRKALLERLRPGRTEEEMLELIHRAEFIKSEEQRQQIERMVEFHEMRVREVMIPRLDIKAADIGMSITEVEAIMSESGVTRLPVIEGDLDRIMGFVHVWDLFAARVNRVEPSLKDLLRPCPKVSELERISGVLSDMRKGSHLAIVMDEFGGTAGLVTLSDLLEEIVGPMDERSGLSGGEDYLQTDSGFEVLARMHVEDLAELLEMELPQGDFDTVAGLIINEIGRIPVRGERLLVAGLDVHIQEADPRRITKVLIKPAKKPVD